MTGLLMLSEGNELPVYKNVLIPARRECWWSREMANGQGNERGRVWNEKRGIFTRSMRLLACLQVLGQLSKVLGKH